MSKKHENQVVTATIEAPEVELVPKSIEELQMALKEAREELKKAKAAKANGTKKTRYLRITAVAEILRDHPTATADETCDLADALYVQNGGKSNPKETRANYRYALPVAQVFRQV